MNLGKESERIEFKRSTGEHREAVASCRELSRVVANLSQVGAKPLCNTGKREV